MTLYDVLKQIANLRWVVVVYSVIIILICGIIWFNTRNFTWQNKRKTSFAMLYNLKQKGAISFALLLGRFCFVLTSAIFCKYINIGYLAVLIAFCLILVALTLDVKEFVSNIVNSVLIFAILFLEKTLFDFYTSVESVMAILLMVIMMGIFVVLYSFLQTINSYDRLLVIKK